MNRSQSETICPACDGTEYVLRDGSYYCKFCNMQSQELGHETVMDVDAFNSMGGGRGDKTSISQKSKTSSKKHQKEKERTRRLLQGERWSTAEGYSWILRGWVLKLKEDMNIDVEIAVLQLWSLYLRELKLAFERAGEEGCQHPKNMRQRDRLEIISAAPGISSYNYFKPKKRKKEESSDDDDEAETLHMLRKQRRMRNKKLKEFFNKTISDTESMMSDSSNKSLSSIRSDNPGSESESAISSDGYITDTSTVFNLMKRFTKRERTHQVDSINMKNVAAVFTLAVVSRVGITVMIEDVVRWFNSELLPWTTAYTLIPGCQYKFKEFCGFGEWTFDQLSRLTWRMSSFLPPAKTSASEPLKIILVTCDDSKGKSLNKKSFEDVLGRILSDLCLPDILLGDIIATFFPLHLFTLGIDIEHCEDPEIRSQSWFIKSFPSVFKRVFALIVLALKLHFSVDDQYEYYYSHNVRLLKKWGKERFSHEFDYLQWLQLSKLRLDHLMGESDQVRDQYKSMSHLATPPLSSDQVLEKLKHFLPSDKSSGKFKQFDSLTPLLKKLSVQDNSSQESAPPPVSEPLKPLYEATQNLLNSGAVKHDKVRQRLEELLDMTSTTIMAGPLFINKHERGKVKYQNKSNRSKKNLKINYECIEGGGSETRSGNHKKIFTRELYTGRVRRSSALRVVSMKSLLRNRSRRVKNTEDSWYHTNKKYWFADPAAYFPNEKMKIHQEFHNRFIYTKLPDTFSWMLQYFSCYSGISPVEILQEVFDIETLILHLNINYFGYFKAKTKLGQKKKGTKKVYKEIFTNGKIMSRKDVSILTSARKV